MNGMKELNISYITLIKYSAHHFSLVLEGYLFSCYIVTLTVTLAVLQFQLIR